MQNTISFMLFLGLFNASHHKLKIELASRIKFDSSTAAARPLKNFTSVAWIKVGSANSSTWFRTARYSRAEMNSWIILKYVIKLEGRFVSSVLVLILNLAWRNYYYYYNYLYIIFTMVTCKGSNTTYSCCGEACEETGDGVRPAVCCNRNKN